MDHNDGLFALRRGEFCIRPNPGDHKDRPYENLPIVYTTGCGWYGAWLRHPAGVHLSSTGETSKYNTDGTGPPGVPGMFNPDVPVARQFIDTVTGPSSTVTTGDGGDMVACISCHRAHGNPYADMLRWDYSGQLAGGGGNDGTGCFVCYTTKDSE